MSKSDSKTPSPAVSEKVDLVQRAKMLSIPAWNTMNIKQPFKKPRVEKAETKLPFKKPFEHFRAPVSTIIPNKVFRQPQDFGPELI